MMNHRKCAPKYIDKPCDKPRNAGRRLGSCWLTYPRASKTGLNRNWTESLQCKNLKCYELNCLEFSSLTDWHYVQSRLPCYYATASRPSLMSNPTPLSLKTIVCIFQSQVWFVGFSRMILIRTYTLVVFCINEWTLAPCSTVFPRCGAAWPLLRWRSWRIVLTYHHRVIKSSSLFEFKISHCGCSAYQDLELSLSNHFVIVWFWPQGLLLHRKRVKNAQCLPKFCKVTWTQFCVDKFIGNGWQGKAMAFMSATLPVLPSMPKCALPERIWDLERHQRCQTFLGIKPDAACRARRSVIARTTSAPQTTTGLGTQGCRWQTVLCGRSLKPWNLKLTIAVVTTTDQQRDPYKDIQIVTLRYIK